MICCARLAKVSEGLATITSMRWLLATFRSAAVMARNELTVAIQSRPNCSTSLMGPASPRNRYTFESLKIDRNGTRLGGTIAHSDAGENAL